MIDVDFDTCQTPGCAHAKGNHNVRGCACWVDFNGASIPCKCLTFVAPPTAPSERCKNSPPDEMPTFNQCETHGKCFDQDWNDDKGVSHASCLGPVPERILTRLRELERDEARAEVARLTAVVQGVEELRDNLEKNERRYWDIACETGQPFRPSGTLRTLRVLAGGTDTPKGERCGNCGHMPHNSVGFCPNMASDNDCDCAGDTPKDADTERTDQ